MGLVLGRAIPVLAAAAVLGCSEATAPPVHVRPELRYLALDDFYSNPRDSGVVTIEAYPRDPMFRLARGERVRIQLATSAGDAEVLDLESTYCGFYVESFDCTVLVVMMKDGHTIDEVAPLLDAIPARFLLVSPSRSFAAVRVLRKDGIVHAIRLFATHPAVRFVERDAPGWQSSPSALALSALSGSAPFDIGAPIPGDGRVQAQRGDSIILAYEQPNGTKLESVFRLR